MDWSIKVVSDSITKTFPHNSVYVRINVGAKGDKENIQPDFGFNNERPNKNFCLSKSTNSSIYKIRERNESNIAQHRQNMSHTIWFTELCTSRIGGDNKRSTRHNRICDGAF